MPNGFHTRFYVFLALVLMVITIAHVVGTRQYDFGVFYYASHIVLDGHSRFLYDLGTQRNFQDHYGRPHEFLFYYPPFVLLPYIPLALLPITVAFIVWTAISLALLIASVKLLCREADIRFGDWPLLLALTFMPVAAALAHGQLSILCLAAYTWTYMLWRRGRAFGGGVALSLALFKFQLVIGFLCILLCRKRWRELAGFVTGATPLLLISLWITGMDALMRYPAFLFQSDGSHSVDSSKMTSLHGIVNLIANGKVAFVVTVGLSIAALCYAAASWKNLESGFPVGIVAAILVGYHVNPQDLSLSIIPLIMLGHRWAPEKHAIAVVSAIAAPMLLAATGGCFALMAIPLACLLVMNPWRGPMPASPQPTFRASSRL